MLVDELCPLRSGIADLDVKLEAFVRSLHDPGSRGHTRLTAWHESKFVPTEAKSTQVHLAASPDDRTISVPNHALSGELPTCAVDNDGMEYTGNTEGLLLGRVNSRDDDSWLLRRVVR